MSGRAHFSFRLFRNETIPIDLMAAMDADTLLYRAVCSHSTTEEEPRREREEISYLNTRNFPLNAANVTFRSHECDIGHLRYATHASIYICMYVYMRAYIYKSK